MPGRRPAGSGEFRWAAVRAVARAELRYGRRALLALGLVAGVTGALLLGALAVTDRTGSAYGRLAERVGLDDARAYLPADLPQVAAGFGELPGVQESWLAYAWSAQLDGPQLRYVSVIAGPERPDGLVEPVVVAGREPRVEASDELLIGEPLARDAGLRVGDQVTLRMLTFRQVARIAVGVGEPDGATRTMHIVGIGRMPAWGGPLGDAIAGPAFAAQNYGAAIGRAGFARLGHTGDAAADAALRGAFADGLAAKYAGLPRPQIVGTLVPDFPTFPTTDVDPAVPAVQRVLDLGLGGFALVVGFFGIVVVGQGLLRHHVRGQPAQRIEDALGMTAGERVTARALAAGAGAALAGLLGAGGAVAAGLLAPLGSQAAFEPEAGFRMHWLAVLVGGPVVALSFMAIAATTAAMAGLRGGARQVTPRGRPFGWAARWPWVFVGLRLASRGRGTVGGNVGLVGLAAGLGVTVACAGIVASLVVGASLTRLVDTPARYGFTTDLRIATARPADVAALVEDPRVESLTVVRTGRARIAAAEGGRQPVPSAASAGKSASAVPSAASAGKSASAVDLYAHDRRKGQVAVTMVAGRLPLGNGEIAVGTRVALRDQLTIGDTVRVQSSTGRTAELVVSGIAVPQPERGAVLGDSAIVTPDGLTGLLGDQVVASTQIIAAPGAGPALYDDLSRRLETYPPAPPAQILTLMGLLWLPEILAGMLAAFTVAGLVHTITAAVRRHAREMAVLSVLGATPAQVRSTIWVVAASAVLPGVAGGIVVGLGVGRLLWWQVASNAGVAPDITVPMPAIAMVIALVLGGASVVGTVLTLSRTRVPVALTLRTV